MASVVPLRRTANPPVERAGAYLPRPAIPGGFLVRLTGALLRRALARRGLRALTNHQLRDIGLERRDVADPLEACRQVQAWAEHGSAGWAPVPRPAARR